MTKLISFTDNGIGIDEKYQDKIFEFFQRLQGKQITKVRNWTRFMQLHNWSL